MSALRPPVARIAHRARKRHASEPPQFSCSSLDLHPDFKMPRVIPERDRLSIRRAQPALRAEHEELRPVRKRGVPSHADILREPKKIAARCTAEQFRREWQRAFRAGGVRADLENVGVVGGGISGHAGVGCLENAADDSFGRGGGEVGG